MTVDVEYVHSSAYLGVYRYTLASDSFDLIKEVGGGYTGSIKTTTNHKNEIYVQMYPSGGTASAKFTVSTKQSPFEGLSTIEILGIIFGPFLGVVIIGLIGYLLIKWYTYKRKKKPKRVTPYPSTSRTQDQMTRNNDNIFYIGYNQQPIPGISYQTPIKQETPIETPIPLYTIPKVTALYH